MRKPKDISFSEQILLAYREEDPKVNCPSITFQVTDDCCLQCSYCYQINKGHRMMSHSTIKSGIDLLFKMYEEDNEEALINHHTKGLILDFIGGEPFMNVDTMSYGAEYFIDRCIQEDHIWLSNFKISISSNGILFFEPEVQQFIKRFAPFLSMTITIDGPKHLHDACRKDFDGNGSFDRAIKAYRALRDDFHFIPNTKVTIAPENLSYLNEIIDFFINEGATSIHANPIFEHKWTPHEGSKYYQELKKLALRLVEQDDIQTNIFNANFGIPLTSDDNMNWCGGTGKMLAFNPDGIAYPCIRYMESSLGATRKPIIVGNVNGIYQTNEEKELYNYFNTITRRSQSTDECWNCSIANGCAWCTAWNYQELGTCNQRSTNICWMHRAKSLANSFYLNTYYRKNDSYRRMPVYLERNIATQIISDEEYDMLLKLSFIR